MAQSAGAVRLFSEEDLREVDQACRLAEELVGEFFRVSCFGPDRYVYEVATLADLNERERAMGALAHLVRYVRKGPGPGHQRMPQWFYRVCLQDDAILAAVDRAAGDYGLRELLVFVLTHELVHVVRFERFERHFEVSEDVRRQEEETVDHLTLQILHDSRLPGLDRVCREYLSRKLGSRPFRISR